MFPCKTITICAILLHLVQTQDFRQLIYQVILFGYGADPEELCGGALLHYDWIVTSYKCVDNLFHKVVSVKVIGGFSPEYGGCREDRDMTYYARNSGKMTDLGLVQVDQPFTIANDMQVCKLPTPEQKLCDKPHSILMSEKDVIEKNKKPHRISKNNKHKSNQKMVVMCRIEYSIRNWTIIGHLDNSTQKKIVSVEKGPPETCHRNQGWPIYCDDVMVGIEVDCKASEGVNNVVMAPIAEDVEVILRTIREKEIRDKQLNDGRMVMANKGNGFHKLDAIFFMVAFNTFWRELR